AELVRQTLPHWLNHVVEHWIRQRLDQWTVDVMTELKEVRITEEDAQRAQLLIPALHPPPLRGESQWARRLGTTAALGGGTLLLLVGQWIPGFIAISGGLAWSAFGESTKDEATRVKLVESATEALRKMGQRADQALREQIRQFELDAATLAEKHEKAEQKRQSDTRAALRVQLDYRKSRQRELTEICNDLVHRIEALDIGQE
ncbi:MAG: hypothetical protein HN348_29785, partial [Proteobacteria bacterium]|nr:hypothetical protein [Pseudomonadota bacterium]